MCEKSYWINESGKRREAEDRVPGSGLDCPTVARRIHHFIHLYIFISTANFANGLCDFFPHERVLNPNSPGGPPASRPHQRTEGDDLEDALQGEEGCEDDVQVLQHGLVQVRRSIELVGRRQSRQSVF